MADVAEWRLDDPDAIEAADPGSMLRQVASSAAQVRSALLATQETDFGELVAAGRPRAIVVSGMGGSGIAGDVLAAVCGTGSAAQIVSVHGYQLPGWVSAADLVIAVSCSGSTEETLAAAEDAVRRGCRLVGVGGASSPLAGLAEQAHAPFVPVRSAGMPRSTLWGLSIPLIGVAARFGLCEAGPEAHEAAAVALEGISQRCRPGQRLVRQPGQGPGAGAGGQAAHDLGHLAAGRRGRLPVLLPAEREREVPGDPGRAARGEPQPGRRARRAVRARPRAAPNRRCRCTWSCWPTPVSILRWPSAARLPPQLAGERGIGVTELTATGDHPLERLASLVQLIDYATVYLGIALGYDPSPITAIQELKASIA